MTEQQLQAAMQIFRDSLPDDYKYSFDAMTQHEQAFIIRWSVKDGSIEFDVEGQPVLIGTFAA